MCAHFEAAAADVVAAGVEAVAMALMMVVSVVMLAMLELWLKYQC
jgi:hypothetical protein